MKFVTPKFTFSQFQRNFLFNFNLVIHAIMKTHLHTTNLVLYKFYFFISLSLNYTKISHNEYYHISFTPQFIIVNTNTKGYNMPVSNIYLKRLINDNLEPKNFFQVSKTLYSQLEMKQEDQGHTLKLAKKKPMGHSAFISTN